MNKKSSEFNELTLKIILILVTLTCILSTIGLVYFYQRYVSTAEELQTIKTGYSMKISNPGEEVMTPDFGITINSAKKDLVGIPNYLPVPEGFEFFTIDLTVSNKTSEDKLFLPVNSTYLKDQNGNKYSLTATPQVEQGIAGNIPVGDTAKGQIGFMIPSNIDLLKFYFEPYGQSGGETAVIDLTSLL